MQIFLISDDVKEPVKKKINAVHVTSVTRATSRI